MAEAVGARHQEHWSPTVTSRRSQDLWVGMSCDVLVTSDILGSFESLPLMKTAPARTSATRWGPLTACQRAWADSMSLNAIAIPAAREPGP